MRALVLLYMILFAPVSVWIRPVYRWIVAQPVFDWMWLVDSEYRAMYRAASRQVRDDVERYGVESAFALEDRRLEREFPGITEHLVKARRTK